MKKKTFWLGFSTFTQFLFSSGSIVAAGMHGCQSGFTWAAESVWIG